MRAGPARAIRKADRVRGDVTLTARLLLRWSGVAGVCVALGGSVMLLAAWSPWYAVIVEVTMLGDTNARTVAALRGVPWTWTGWTVAVLGVGGVVLGALVAIDRTPLRARLAAVVLGVGAGVVAVVAVVTIPEVSVIASGATDQLVAAGTDLPRGVDLELHGIAAAGPWSAMGGALAVVLGAVCVRDR